MAKKKQIKEQVEEKPQTPVVIVELSSCFKCGSTERSNYYHTQKINVGGIHNGRSYNLVVKRYCYCLKCKQRRMDKTYVYKTILPIDGNNEDITG